jgi:GntR family transcriptional regulator
MAWEPNQPIPSEAQLCNSYSVSRTTVRKALDYLIYEGLLYRVQGKGTFVSPPRFPERFAQKSFGFYEDMRSRGLPIKTLVLEQGIVPANQRIAKKLDIRPGEEVFRLVRLRYVNNEPNHISKAHVPHYLCPGIALEDLTNQSLYRVMSDKYDIMFHHGIRCIEAHLSTDEEAALLQIPPASPLLVVYSTVFDQKDRPVEFGYAKNRGDRSQVEIDVITGEQHAQT